MNIPKNKNNLNHIPAERWLPLQRGLVLQLFTIIILPLTVLLILTAFFGLNLHQEAMRKLAAERNERTARSIANTLNELIQQQIEITQQLAQSADPNDTLEGRMGALNSAAALPGMSDAGLAFADAEGNLLTTAGDPSMWENIDRDPLVDLFVQNAPGEVISQSLTSQKNGSPFLLVAASSNDLTTFAVSVSSPAKLIARALEGVFPGSGEYGILLVSGDKQVIYRVGGKDLIDPSSDHPGIQQALQAQSGSTYTRVGNAEYILAYSPVQPLGWALVIEEPWATSASRVLRLTENAPLVLIPIIALTALALWFTSRYIVRPLRALESKAVELGWGNYQAIEEPVGGIDEIQNLQNELVHLAQKVNAAQKGMRDYISAITSGQEDERRRLARELHDDTLQSLIALNQRLQLFQMVVKDDPQISTHNEALNQLQSMIEETIQELRRITRALRPIYLEDLGLVAALEMLAKEIQQTGELTVHCKREGVEARLNPEVELALYRIAQEALNNVLKHAQADRVDLRINYETDLVTLEVSDNGKGYKVPDSPAAFAPGGHFGLLGMYERAEMIGAQFVISSSSDKGSKIIVKFPLSPALQVRIDA